MKYALKLLSDENNKIFAISGTTFSIGRDAKNDIQLMGEKISRCHAKVEVSENKCIIEDLKSSNGTNINGTVVSKHELVNKDIIKIGDKILEFLAIDDSEKLTDDFVPRQYGDKNFYSTIKVKRRPGFLKSIIPGHKKDS